MGSDYFAAISFLIIRKFEKEMHKQLKVSLTQIEILDGHRKGDSEEIV